MAEERHGGTAATVAMRTTMEDTGAATQATEAAVPTHTRVVLAGRVATITAAECQTVSLVRNIIVHCSKNHFNYSNV